MGTRKGRTKSQPSASDNDYSDDISSSAAKLQQSSAVHPEVVSSFCEDYLIRTLSRKRLPAVLLILLRFSVESISLSLFQPSYGFEKQKRTGRKIL